MVFESWVQELKRKKKKKKVWGQKKEGSGFYIAIAFSLGNLYEFHRRPQGKEFSTWAAGGSVKVLEEAG